jgi:hypothetical protein
MATLGNNFDRLGYYLVGWKKFYNKTLALIYANQFNFEIRWIFNDDIYEKIDWSIPIEESLESLYLRRAKQLRETYDYLILYYSGGSDSHNILTVFLNNNIFIDEIVMELPVMDRKNFSDHDTTSRNLYGEIDYIATPRLKELQHKLNPSTKIRYDDFAKPVFDLLKKDDWFETVPTNAFLNLGQIGRQMLHIADTNIIDASGRGKRVCQVFGVDKPLVTFDGNDYFAYFSDSSATHVNPLIPENAKNYDDVTTEYFYWTPDIPEIVVKQAQLIKLACERDPIKKSLWKQSLKTPISNYRSVMHPIIYPGIEEPKFQTSKPESNIIRPMDDWFWETASNKMKDNFLYTVQDFLVKNIQAKYFGRNNIDGGLKAIQTKFYKL